MLIVSNTSSEATLQPPRRPESENSIEKSRIVNGSDVRTTVMFRNLPNWMNIHDLKRLFSKIYEALLPGGNFVFSVEHPIFTAPTSQIWQTGEQQEPVWPLNSYFREGLREYEWLGSSVQKCHRTIETYVRILIRCQFTLVDLEEFRPSDQDLETHPEWSNDRERPMFLLISARKN